MSVASDDSIEKNPTGLSRIVLKTGSRIIYEFPGKIAFREAIVPGIAGKGTSKIKHGYNVEKEDDTLGSLNMEEVAEWKNLEDAPEALMASHDNCIEVKQAKAVKLNTCKDLKVYEKVQNQVQRFVTTVWAVIEKYKERIRVTKACLVWLEASRKMIEIDLEKICQYVVKKASDCCFLFWFSMGGKYINWTSNQQYLQEKQVTHNLFIKPSKEVETDQIWKLKRLYME